MHKVFSSLKLYSFVILFILVWWTLAFRPNSPASSNDQIASAIPDPRHSKQQTYSPISYVTRDTLQQALRGDFTLMTRLISEWDIDAQILQSSGLIGVKRLSQQDFLRSQWIGRQLSEHKDRIDPVIANHQYIIDDTGTPIPLQPSYHRFLPHTYAAASFLLAIAPLNEIVALPRKLREQEQIYPKEITDQILLDIDRYNSEKLFLANPQIAFVAHYSHPATIQALTNQGIALYTMKNLNSLSDISEELMKLGVIIHRPLQAELLKIFIDASMFTIDNKLLTLLKTFQDIGISTPRLLFLYYNQNFSIPTPKTLTGQLLERMNGLDISLKYVIDNEKNREWMLPIDKERILNLDPDCLIIAAENSKALEKEIRETKAFQHLSAIKNNHLYFVDEAIQQTPSQYIVLAYYDLIQAVDLLQ